MYQFAIAAVALMQFAAAESSEASSGLPKETIGAIVGGTAAIVTLGLMFFVLERKQRVKAQKPQHFGLSTPLEMDIRSEDYE